MKTLFLRDLGEELNKRFRFCSYPTVCICTLCGNKFVQIQLYENLTPRVVCLTYM